MAYSGSATPYEMTTASASWPCCLSTVSALGGDDQSLRAIDAETEVELDSTVGEVAASVRLCTYGRGPKGSLNARIELRSVNSTARGLWATRLLSPAE